MTPTCTATRRDGQPCTARPLPGETACWAHSDSTQEQRESAREAGGRASSRFARAARNLPPELQDIQRRLMAWIESVEAGKLSPRQAEVIGGLCGRLLDIAKFAHEVGTLAEVEERIAQLEQQLKEQAN